MTVLFGTRSNHFQPYWGKFWQRCMAGLWPGAKVRNVLDDIVVYEGPGAPRRAHSAADVQVGPYVVYRICRILVGGALVHSLGQP